MPTSVAIFGSGNMAYHLLKAFDKSHHRISGLITRDESKGRELIHKTGVSCDHFQGHDLCQLTSDIIILTVPESSITEVVKTYDFGPDQVVVHTSGATPLDILPFAKAGVFYPLQTLTQEEAVDYSGIPILIEGSDRMNEQILIELGQGISRNVRTVSSENRLQIHMAAVLACNFPNHLFKKASQILNGAGFDLEILYPLMEETLRKLKAIGPERAQTGPARRGDHITISRHLDLIKDQELRQMYEIFSNDIRRDYE